jgi:hypothetical protein
MGDRASGSVGQPITAGGYVLTVQAVDPSAAGPDRFTNPKPGNRLVKVDFTMENRDGLILPVWASYFSIKDSAGIDNPVRTDVSGDQYLKQRFVPPGGSTQATIYVEVASNLRAQHLVFDPDVLGWTTRIEVALP